MMDAGAVYGPDYIMDKQVVMVTFNYRLGALGNYHGSRCSYLLYT